MSKNISNIIFTMAIQVNINCNKLTGQVKLGAYPYNN